MLGEALRHGGAAASTDEARPILTGAARVENDGLRLVATDSVPTRGDAGCQRARCRPEGARPRGVRSTSCSGCSASARSWCCGWANATPRSRSGDSSSRPASIEGEFPNYRQLIPAATRTRSRVDREPLLEAIRRGKILARDATPVRLQISADALKLTAITQDVPATRSRSSTPRATGTDLTVAFNPDYLASGVEAVGAEQVTLLDDRSAEAGGGTRGSDDYLYPADAGTRALTGAGPNRRESST
ncbi:MAG: hypothetical protein R2713_12740 [Ilumatobacteraceae bacterium]